VVVELGRSSEAQALRSKFGVAVAST